MSWLFLLVAILLEVLALVAMKESNGLSKLIPTVLIVSLLGLSLAAETVALKKIDLMQAYVVWVGVGTAFAALVAVFYFKEPFSVNKGLFIGLVLVGVVGLSLSK